MLVVSEDAEYATKEGSIRNEHDRLPLASKLSTASTNRRICDNFF
jgi:hypothetical protein